MIFRILALVVVLALLAATFLFERPGTERDQAPVAPLPPGDTGYSSRDAEIIETGPDGQPRYRLEADRIDQRPRTGDVTLEHVTMHYRTELGTLWQLRADHGELPEDARNVALRGSVVVNGPIGPSAPGAQSAGRTSEIQLLTERLNVDTLEQIVTTPAPVTVLWAGERLESRGLWANLKEQRLRLESNVHGRFASH